MTLRSVVRIIIVLAVLVVAFWFTLRSVDFDAVASSVENISWLIIIGVVPIILASHYVRALRWVTILSPSVPKRRVWPAFSAVLVGYATSVIIPRSGELIRPWIFSRRTGVALGTSISSVVVERVLDVLTLLIGLGAVLMFQRDRVLDAVPSLSAKSLLISIVLPLFILSVAIILIAFTQLGLRFATMVRKRMHRRFGTWLYGVMEHVRQGTVAVRKPSLWATLFFHTALMWFLYALPLFFLFKAMPIQSLNVLGLSDAVFMLVILSVGVTIAPTPGALGVYQGFAQTALVQAYSASPAEGFAFGIVAWIVNYGVALVSGAICLVIEFQSGLTMKAIKRVRQDVQESSSRT